MLMTLHKSAMLPAVCMRAYCASEHTPTLFRRSCECGEEVARRSSQATALPRVHPAHVLGRRQECIPSIGCTVQEPQELALAVCIHHTACLVLPPAVHSVEYHKGLFQYLLGRRGFQVVWSCVLRSAEIRDCSDGIQRPTTHRWSLTMRLQAIFVSSSRTARAMGVHMTRTVSLRISGAWETCREEGIPAGPPRPSRLRMTQARRRPQKVWKGVRNMVVNGRKREHLRDSAGSF